MKLHQGPTP